VALGNLIACVAALPLALPATSISGKDAAVLLYLGTVQIGLAYLCLTRGIRHVPALEATTLLMAEPALNPVWTWLVHAETPGAWALRRAIPPDQEWGCPTQLPGKLLRI
jgi:drug/metabolite transporter (DMT)-like permease